MMIMKYKDSSDSYWHLVMKLDMMSMIRMTFNLKIYQSFVRQMWMLIVVKL